MSGVQLRADTEQLAVLTLNRSDKLNAISYGLADELMDALDAIETDRTVRAVILTCAGERAFSAGDEAAAARAAPRKASA